MSQPFDVEERTFADADTSISQRVAPAPTGPRQMSGKGQAVSGNVIPFAKPRAISSGHATFSPVSSAPTAGPTWGSKPAPAQPANPFTSTGSSWGSKPALPTPGLSYPAVSSHAPKPSAQQTQAPYSGGGSAAPALFTQNQPAMQPLKGPMPGQPARMPQASIAPPIAQPAAKVAQQMPIAQPQATPAKASPIPQVNLAALQQQAAAAPANRNDATTVDAKKFDATAVTPPPLAKPVSASPIAGALATASRWAAFENLGLRAPKLDRNTLSKHVVTAYRLLGFVILTIIVLALVSYLVTTAFFYVSDSWVVPMAVSPTDEKVVALESQLAERQTNRDRTAAELDQAERAIVVQQEFQAQFALAIKSDLEGRKAALAKMYELANKAASTRAQIKRSNSAYASAEQKRMADEWQAGLIDRDEMLNGRFQQAQISGSNLNLAERQAEYETRAADLESQTDSLETLLTQNGGDKAMSYDVLKIKQEYEASRLETQRAIENRDMLKSALVREDKLLEALKNSSYLKAMADGAHVAFVPYSNVSNVKKGQNLYGCALTMVFCKKVGTVLEVLPGEVQFKHPNRDKQLRGQMIELKLDNPESATDDVLFVGGRPLLL